MGTEGRNEPMKKEKFKRSISDERVHHGKVHHIKKLSPMEDADDEYDYEDFEAVPDIVYFEKLQTAWSGLCYNITVDFHIIGRPFFHLKFSESLDSKDIPVPKIYLTSYE